MRAFKVAAFAISGAVTAFAGALHAMLIGVAPLSNIDYHTSETLLIMTIIGGSANLFASLLGPGAYLLAADTLSAIWPRWLLLLGLLLIVHHPVPAARSLGPDRAGRRPRDAGTPRLTTPPSTAGGGPARARPRFGGRPMSAPILATDGLGVRYGSFVALQDVTLRIAENSVHRSSAQTGPAKPPCSTR